jgi:predicted small secreted protein
MDQQAGAHACRCLVQEDLMKKLFAILALSTCLVATAACNTVRGAGRDIESAANAVDRAT